MADVIAYFDVLEGGICQRINSLSRRAWIRRLFTFVSKAGDGSAWFVFGGVILLIDGSAALPAMGRMLITAAAGIAVYKLLKNRLVRERPFISHGNIECATAPLDRYSFPSGHTLHAVSFAIMLTHYLPALGWIVIPFAVLVAASRTILGLHYPSDVIVGALIGALLAGTSISLA